MPATSTNGWGGRRPGAGPPANVNALRHGARSRRLAPLFRAAGPHGRAFIVRAITIAVADALGGATPRPSGRKSRGEARPRTAARGYALVRVLRLLQAAADFPGRTTWRARDILVALAPIWLDRRAAPPDPNPRLPLHNDGEGDGG